MPRRRLLPTFLLAYLVILLGGCSEDTPVNPKTTTGVSSEIVAEALSRVDYQRNLAEAWLGSWQEYAGRPGTNWSYSETDSCWIMTTTYHQSAHVGDGHEMTEIRRETSEHWRITLLRDGLPVRDWSLAEALIASWNGQIRRYAVDESFHFATPFLYDYEGEVRAELREGRIQAVVGAGTVAGWQAFLQDQEQERRYLYTAGFTLEIPVGEYDWRCPPINLSITLAVQDAQGDQVDTFSGVLTMPANSGHYAGRIQSHHGTGAWVVDARRSCGE